MKVVVTGGRNYEHADYVYLVLDSLHREIPITMLIHGACGWDADDPNMSANPMRGADGLADTWARDRGVPFERVPAAWTSGGPAAGPIRNGLMLDRKPALVVAFPGDRGTANCVRQARRRHIPVVSTMTILPGIGWQRIFEIAGFDPRTTPAKETP